MRRVIDAAAVSGRSPSRRGLLGASALLGLGMSPALAAPRPDERFPVLRGQVPANGASFHVVEQGRQPLRSPPHLDAAGLIAGRPIGEGSERPPPPRSASRSSS